MAHNQKEAVRELLGHAEAAVEHFAPALGSYAVAALPLVRKGLKALIKLIEDRGHEDAERILDELLEKGAARLELPGSDEAE
jgi:hypothetical protein